MFFLIHAEWSAGLSGGYSHHGLKVQEQDNKNKWKKPADGHAHGGYAKCYLNYAFNMVNNLDISVEGFVGYTFKDLKKENDPFYSPGIFYGLAVKPKLDFDDSYNLYLIAGVQFSHPKIYNFKIGNINNELKDGATRHWFINPMFGGGFCYYLSENVGAFVEATYVGLSSGDVKKKEKGIFIAKNEALRIGVGLNIKYE